MIDIFLPYLILIYAAVCVFMVFLSWLNNRAIKTRMTKLIFHFWLIQGANFILSGVTSSSAKPSIITIGVFIWPLIVLNLHNIMQELEKKYKEKMIWTPMIVGYGITTVLMFQDVSLTVMSLPGVWSMGIVGLYICWRFLKLQKNRSMSTLEKFYIIISAFMFLHMMDWPILRPEEKFVFIGYSLFIVIVVGFASVLPALSLQNEGERQRLVLEDLVEKRTQQLFHQSKFSALGEMAAGMAHEINNPLSIIVLKVGQLSKKAESGEVSAEMLKSGLSSIEKTAFRISSIIAALREFSRESADLKKQTITINDALSEILIFCEERFKNHGVSLIIEGDKNIEIKTYGPQLSQVFLNLLNNSFDALTGLPEKWIKISITTEEGKVKISVTDSGPKIPEAIQEKLMQPFFTTKDIGKGTGLGLAISKGIIEKHHGELFYDQVSPYNSFVVVLPI